MENTNEKIENEMLDTVAGGTVEQNCEVVEEQEQQEQEPTSTEEQEESPLNVLKRYPKVCERIASLMQDKAESLAMELLQKGMGYDEAVANADKEGYLRGKNEKIELVKGHRMPQLDKTPQPEEQTQEMLFPRYGKRSVWE